MKSTHRLGEPKWSRPRRRRVDEIRQLDPATQKKRAKWGLVTHTKKAAEN